MTQGCHFGDEGLEKPNDKPYVKNIYCTNTNSAIFPFPLHRKEKNVKMFDIEEELKKLPGKPRRIFDEG